MSFQYLCICISVCVRPATIGYLSPLTFSNVYARVYQMLARVPKIPVRIVAWELPDNYPRSGSPDWEWRKCAEGMGLHLVQPFDYISPCGETPVQGLYDQGNLIGFAWSVWWLGGPVDRLQGDRWEDPNVQEIQDNMKL